jgi:hypothetical protein
MGVAKEVFGLPSKTIPHPTVETFIELMVV